MTTITVRMRNPLYEKRHLYATYIPEYNDYKGEVLTPPKWCTNEQFCISDPSAKGTKYKFRILERKNIIHGWLHSRSNT